MLGVNIKESVVIEYLPELWKLLLKVLDDIKVSNNSNVHVYQKLKQFLESCISKILQKLFDYPYCQYGNLIFMIEQKTFQFKRNLMSFICHL